MQPLEVFFFLIRSCYATKSEHANNLALAWIGTPYDVPSGPPAYRSLIRRRAMTPH